MTGQKKFALGKAPYIRRADSTQSTATMMRDFTISLIPLIIFAWIKNGLMPFINKDTTSIIDLLYPLILVFVGGFTSLLLEFIYFKFIKNSEKPFEDLKYSFSIIPGLLLAMIIPLNTPIWVLVLGCVFATVIAKLLFGGFGKNIFNPALVGYLFITTAYFGVISSGKGFLNATEYAGLEAISRATPMTYFQENLVANVDVLVSPYGNLWNFFIGTIPGSLAETSALLCLVAFVYLVVRKVINWKIPVFYVGTVFVLTYIIGAVNGHATDLRYPLYGILSGGLMFGAVFMATEPVTSPRTPNGKIIYGISLGVLTVLFRYKSNLPEGVATAIITMNLFTVIIDTLAAKLRVSRNLKKVVLTYSVIGLMLAGIGTYAITASIPQVEEEVEEELVVEYKSGYQDLYDLNFVFNLTIDGENVKVTTDQTYEITSISVSRLNNDEVKEAIKKVVKGKFNVFITNVEVVEGVYTLTVKTITEEWGGVITHVITLDNNFRINSMVSDTSNETYYENTEDPKDVMPGRIIAGQDNLDDVKAVSGATLSSNAFKTAAKYIQDYVKIVIKGEVLDTNSELQFISNEQNFETLGFNYTFSFGRSRVVVTTDKEYNITNVDKEYFNTDDFKTKFSEIIKTKKIFDYIINVEEVDGIYTITVKTVTEQYGGVMTHVITLDNNFKISSMVSDTSEESYYENTQDPKVVMPDRIIAGQDNLDEVKAVSGATLSSNAFIKAAKLAKTYVNEVLKNE